MGRPRVQVHCRTCGKPTARRGHWRQGYQCIECAILASEQAAREINSREGEYYERWIAGMARSVDQAIAQLADQSSTSDELPPR